MQKPLRKYILRGVVLLAFIALSFYLASLARDSEAIRQIVGGYGYAGIFLIALISGFNLAVPIPAAALVPLFLESGLSFWPTIFLITLGMTGADFFAYFLGDTGRRILGYAMGEKTFARLARLRERYPRAPLIILFVFACIAPLPNELLLIPFAILGFPFRIIVPIVFVGNFIFNILFSKGLLELFSIL